VSDTCTSRLICLQWCTAPYLRLIYAHVPHPVPPCRYFGSALSVWGVAAILLNQLPTDWSIASPLGGPPLAISTSALALAVYWTLLYVVTGWQEQYL
jgi:hypothetical protein